jgi:hypothetical protein
MKPLAASAALIAAVFGAVTAFAADPAAGKKVVQGNLRRLPRPRRHAKNPDAPHLAGENIEYLLRQLKAFKSGERARADVHHRPRPERRRHGECIGLVFEHQDQGGDAEIGVL